MTEALWFLFGGVVGVIVGIACVTSWLVRQGARASRAKRDRREYGYPVPPTRS